MNMDLWICGFGKDVIFLDKRGIKYSRIFRNKIEIDYLLRIWDGPVKCVSAGGFPV